MDDAQLRTAIAVARAGERLNIVRSGDWPDIAVSLLVAGREEAQLAELAGLPKSASGWDTDPLVADLSEQHGVTVPSLAEATDLMARLMAQDLRQRPAAVSAPMIRVLASLASPDFESDLAAQCAGIEEYLDCECVARVDTSLEVELEQLPELELPDLVVEILARQLRAALPLTQPDHGH